MTIDLSDYRRTAAQRGWGTGWPSCAGTRNNLAVVTADRSGTRITVNKVIARLVDMLIDETERRGYLLIIGQCGGFNCRAIGGTKSPSNHSWGLAADINWQRNPRSTPLKSDIPQWMIELWNEYGFAWGGLYNDPMHFEFMGTIMDANDMTKLAIDQLLTPAPAPAPTPTITFENDEDDMQLPPSHDRRDFQIPAGIAGRLLLSANSDENRNTTRVWGIYAVIDRGPSTPPDVVQMLSNPDGAIFPQWWPFSQLTPAGTTSIIVNYASPVGMVARVNPA